jgi:hypothetical protein
MTWIIDGNNLLGMLRKGPKRSGDRERLLERLCTYRLPSPCLVVFDGPPPVSSLHKARRGKVLIQYASPRKADDVIVERVRAGDTVVTADRELALRCRDRQAKVLSPSAFMDGLKPRTAGQGEKPSAASVDVQDWLDFFGRP